MRMSRFSQRVYQFVALATLPDVALAHGLENWMIGLMLWYFIGILLFISYLAMGRLPLAMRFGAIIIAIFVVAITWVLGSVSGASANSFLDTFLFSLVWLAPGAGWFIGVKVCGMLNAHLTSRSTVDARQETPRAG